MSDYQIVRLSVVQSASLCSHVRVCGCGCVIPCVIAYVSDCVCLSVCLSVSVCGSEWDCVGYVSLRVSGCVSLHVS